MGFALVLWHFGWLKKVVLILRETSVAETLS